MRHIYICQKHSLKKLNTVALTSIIISFNACSTVEVKNFMGYTKKVIAGFSWESSLKIALYALTILKTYFLARILDPADFGLFSLVVIAIGLSEAMTQTGINLTIIQSKNSVDYFLNTAWVISIVRGFLIGIAMIIIGFLMSNFFKEQSLLILVMLAAMVPVIKGFINPYVVVFHKKMLFLQDIIYRLAVQASLVIGTLLLGLWLKNAYALVLGLVLAAIIEVLASFAVFKQKPAFEYIPSRARVIFDNAKWLSVGSALHYLVEHIDDFLIGAITNTHALGIYHNAYGLTHKASYEISKSVHYGTIPVFSKLTQQKKRLKRAFGKTIISTVLIILAIAGPIYIFNQQVVTILLGEKWLEAIPLVRPLILAGSIQSLFMICYTLMLASKKYKVMNLHLFLSVILMTGFVCYFGTNYGLLGAVNGIVYSRLVALPVVIWYIYRYFQKDD